MSALIVLIPVSIGMGLVGLGAFFWAMRRDQFEDPEGNAWRILAPETSHQHEGMTHDHLAPQLEDRNAAGGL